MPEQPVAGLGEVAATARAAAGVLAGHQADVGHEGGGAAEAVEITRLGHDRHRGEEANAADRLEGPEQFDVGAGSAALEQGRVEAPDPLGGGSDACQVVIEGDLSGAIAEGQRVEPGLVLGETMPGPPSPAR